MDDVFESEEFFDLMQAYRWARTNADTVEAYEAVKAFIRTNTTCAA